MLKGAVKSSDAERINAKKEDQNKGDDGEEEQEEEKGKVWPVCTQKGGHRYHPAPEIISTMPGSNAWKPPLKALRFSSKQGTTFLFIPPQNNLHLGMMEVVFIAVMKPELCCQKDFVRSLALLL